MMHQIQILLPLSDNHGNPFPAEYFSRVREELTQKYKGLTAYSRSPAVGLWKDSDACVQKDDIVVLEVMSETLDKAWWKNYRLTLQELFRQDEIIVREQVIQLL